MFPQVIFAAPSASNSAGASILPPSQGDAYVNFRPKPDWRAEEYGFDWVRDEDFEVDFSTLPKDPRLVDPSVKVKYGFSKNVGFSFLNGRIESGAELNPQGQFRFDKPLFDKLMIQEYKKFPVDFNNVKTDNFVSYLSVFMEDADTEKTVEIQIQVKKLLPPVKLEYKFDASLFVIDPAAPPQATTVALSHPNTATNPPPNPALIRIKCKKLSSDQTIEVVAVTPANGSQPEKRQTVGRLIVVKNNAPKTLNALLINVKTGSFSASGLNAGVQDFARKCLRQASININFVTDPQASRLDVSSDNNFLTNYISNGSVVLDPMGALKEDAGHFCFKKWNVNNLAQRFTGFIKIFSFDKPIAIAPGGILTRLGGVHVGDRIVLMEPDPARATSTFPGPISKSILPHEMLHAIGLPHTFAAGPPHFTGAANRHALFTYQAFTTENVMDYSARSGGEKCALFHWQWNEAFNGV